MTTFAVKILGFVLPTFLFVAPLKADTITEALPRCIELAEGLSQFGLAFQSAGDEMGETTSVREIAVFFSSALFSEAYVNRLVPLLEEEASHDGPVTLSCRPRCSFKPPFVRRRQGFSSPVLSGGVADCRSR